MLLRAICPKTEVNGFEVEVIRHDRNVVSDPTLATYFEERFLEIKAECDGTNPLYPDKARLTLIITRYSKDPDVDLLLRTNSDTVGIMILNPTQLITSAAIIEMRQQDLISAILIIQIKDVENKSNHSAVYALARKQRHLH